MSSISEGRALGFRLSFFSHGFTECPSLERDFFELRIILCFPHGCRHRRIQGFGQGPHQEGSNPEQYAEDHEWNRFTIERTLETIRTLARYYSGESTKRVEALF